MTLYCITCGILSTFTHVRDEMRGRVRWEVYRCRSCGHVVAFAVA